MVNIELLIQLMGRLNIVKLIDWYIISKGE